MNFATLYRILGSFSNDDGDGNENIKTAIGLLRKTKLCTCVTFFFVHFFFLVFMFICREKFPDFYGITPDKWNPNLYRRGRQRCISLNTNHLSCWAPVPLSVRWDRLLTFIRYIGKIWDGRQNEKSPIVWDFPDIWKPGFGRHCKRAQTSDDIFFFFFLNLSAVPKK